MCRRGQARKQRRLRMRHGVPDVKMIVLRDTHKLERREKIHVFMCVVWCGVYTSRRSKRNRHCLQAKHMTLGNFNNQKNHCSSQLDACHHLSDDCHHDVDELDEAAEGNLLHPIFGSTHSASLNLENGSFALCRTCLL